jgi:hypothetical protein
LRSSVVKRPVRRSQKLKDGHVLKNPRSAPPQ